MKRYRVIIERSAQVDIEGSYQWGVAHFGKHQADEWLRHLRRSCRRLATLPERCPIAPEDDEFFETIRHLITGRYRVLFTVTGNTVHILHLRGAYVEKVPKAIDGT
jgi:plasmid stabilization system protein ParE